MLTTALDAHQQHILRKCGLFVRPTSSHKVGKPLGGKPSNTVSSASGAPKIRGLRGVAGRPKGFLNTPCFLPSNRSLLKPPHLPLKGAELSSHTLTPGHNIVRRHYGSNNNRNLGSLGDPKLST